MAKRICDYERSINALMDKVSKYIDHHRQLDKEEIQAQYKVLKSEIREEAHDIQLKENEYCRDTKEFRCYRDGIVEAAAWGFDRPINATVNSEYYSTIEEARYKLAKYIPLSEWERIAEGGKDSVKTTYGN